MNAHPHPAAHGRSDRGPYGTPKPNERFSASGMLRVDYGKAAQPASSSTSFANLSSIVQLDKPNKPEAHGLGKKHNTNASTPSSTPKKAKRTKKDDSQAKDKREVLKKDIVSSSSTSSSIAAPVRVSGVGASNQISKFKIPKVSCPPGTLQAPEPTSAGLRTPINGNGSKEAHMLNNAPILTAISNFKIPKVPKSSLVSLDTPQNRSLGDKNGSRDADVGNGLNSKHQEACVIPEELPTASNPPSDAKMSPNPVAQKESIKRKPGRPKKESRAPSPISKTSPGSDTTGQTADQEDERTLGTPKRNPGRPRKDSLANSVVLEKVSDQLDTDTASSRRRRLPQSQLPVDQAKPSKMIKTNAQSHELKEPVLKKKRGRPSTSVKPSGPVRDVECGICHAKVLQTDFKRHNYFEHNGEARLVGEPPITSEAEKKVAWKSTLDFSKRLLCSKCSKKYVSVLGFIYHMGVCGRTEQDTAAAMQTCPICCTPFLHLNAHMKAQHSEKGRSLTGELDNDFGEKIKRSAAIKALEVLKETDDVEELQKSGGHRFTSPRTHVNHYVVRGWTNQITKNGFAKCRFDGCTNTETNADAMKEHDTQCQFSTKRTTSFCCKMCKFTSEDKSTMLKHVTMHETKELKDKSDEFTIANDGQDSSSNTSSDESAESSFKNKTRTSGTSTPVSRCVHQFGLNDEELRDFKSGNGALRTIMWTSTFRCENYAAPNSIFLDLKTLPAKGYVALREDEFLPHLPPSSVSVQFASASLTPTELLTYMDNKPRFKTLNVFKGTANNGVPTFYCGGPIWAASWCPLPDKDTGSENVRRKQYLAIATQSNAEGSNVLQISTGPGLIQIWDCGTLSYDGSVEEDPRFVMGLAHDCGQVSALQWCPSGCWEPDTEINGEQSERPLRRLGILAAACSDGTVRVYAIPQPSQLVTADKQLPIFRIRAVLTLRLTTSSNCLSLCWDRTKGHRWIVAGFGNGFVGIWDLATTVPYLRVLVEEQLELRPMTSFSAHLVGVKGVGLSVHKGRRYLATSGLEKTVALWDLEDHSVMVNALERPWSTAVLWKLNWPAVVHAHDDSLTGGRAFGSFTDFGFDNAKPTSVWAQVGPHWDISENPFLDILVSGSETGYLVGCYSIPFPKDVNSHAPLSLVRFALFRTDLVDANASASASLLNAVPSVLTSVSITSPLQAKAGDDQDKAKEISTSPESEKRENGIGALSDKGLVFYDVIQTTISKKDPLSKMLGISDKIVQSLNVNITDNITSINKVSCNPNTQSFTWVAACGQSGLVRLVCTKHLNESARVTGILERDFTFS